MYLRLLRRFLFLNVVEDGGGGGASEAPAPVAEAPAPIAAPISAPVAPVVAAPVAPVVPVAKPTMLDAITKGLEKAPTNPIAPVVIPRDPSGRFVPRVDADGKVIPGQVAPVDPLKPPETIDPNDLTTAPEGLTAPAKARFEKLVTVNKELTQKFENADRQVGYIRETFHKQGIKQEQFEQAASLIGMVNRGDFAGAQKILQAQMQQIAVMSGQPIGQIDALASFPDLRQAVDGLQITETNALEIARGRTERQQHQATQQREQQTQQTQQQEQQAFTEGTNAVDAFCKRMQSSDLDYAAIEAKLLPEIPNLLQGMAPKDWLRVVEAQYRIIKSVAGSARQSAPAVPSNPLRPTGHGSLQQAPKSMHEAMWGQPAPR